MERLEDLSLLYLQKTRKFQISSRSSCLKVFCEKAPLRKVFREAPVMESSFLKKTATLDVQIH